MGMHTFHWADYLVFCLTIAISVLIGIYVACSGDKQRTIGEYFMGNLRFLPVTVSLVVTYLSGIAVLGNPAEVYSYGSIYSFMAIGMALGSTISIISTVPLFYKLKLLSFAEFYELRFNSKFLRYTASLFMILQLVLLASIQLYAPSIALEAVSGIPVWVSIVVVGITSTIYTAVGGIKAVIWTDVFQCMVLFAGLVAISVKGTLSVDGFAKVWEINVEWQRAKFFDFDIDLTKRFTTWSLVIGFCYMFFALSTNQMSMQRYTAVPTLQKARLAVLTNIPFFMTGVALTCFTGFVAFAYYANAGCDPVRAGYIQSANQIIPYFVTELLYYPGFPGLFIACLFSASLSTLSSALKSTAAVVFADYVKERTSHMEMSTQANITKFIVFILGIITVALAFVVQQMGGTLVQMVIALLGLGHSPIFAVLFVGCTLPKVGKHLAMLALLAGYVFLSWLTVGSIIYREQSPPLPSPIYACGNQDSNTTLASYVPYNETGLLITKDAAINTMESTNISSTVEQEKSLLLKMYSMSFLYIPVFGFLLVYIICLLAMWIPELQHRGEVPSRLLLPYITRLPCYGKRKEEVCDEDDNTQMKLNEEMMKNNENTVI